MSKVQAIQSFRDSMNGYIYRSVNEIFDCTKARARSLEGRGLVVIINNNA